MFGENISVTRRFIRNATYRRQQHICSQDRRPKWAPFLFHSDLHTPVMSTGTCLLLLSVADVAIVCISAILLKNSF